MAVRHTERFTVASPDELNDLEACLGDGHLKSVRVEIPDGSSALLSAREFRRVLHAARANGVDVEFSTDDPLRQEIARIIGAPLSATAPSAPLRSNAVTRRIEPAETIRTQAGETPLPAADPAPFRPFQTPTAAATRDTDAMEYEESNPSFSFVLTPPRTRDNEDSIPDSRRGTRAETVELYEIWDGYSPAPTNKAARARRRRPRLPRMASLILALVPVLAVMLVAALVILPTATVALTPAVHQISADLTYGVAQPGQTWDITIQPETISLDLSFSAAAPATGERTEPDATASGTILITNASTAEIVVPDGTVFASESGISYVTLDAVSVPAADPFGTLTMGSAAVAVAATVPGPDGNVPAEAIYGQLDNGLFYSNREPISGGTVKHISTVTEEDMRALRERAEADLNAQAASALAASLSAGQQILENSEQRDAIDFRFSHAVGEDAENVKLDATMRVSAQVFSLDAIHGQARDEAARQLAAQAGVGETLLPETISVGEPQPIAGARGTAFNVRASAQTRSNLSDEVLSSLKSDLVGLSPGAAMARIRQVDGVDGIAVTRGPDWLNMFGEQMPRLQSRIKLEVTNAQGVSTQTTTSRP